MRRQLPAVEAVNDGGGDDDDDARDDPAAVKPKLHLPMGVHFRGNSFMARISVAGKSRHLGMFATAALASAAYEAAAAQKLAEAVMRSGLPKGVYATNHGRFGAQISVAGARHYLGSFATVEEAAHAYGAARIQRDSGKDGAINLKRKREDVSSAACLSFSSISSAAAAAIAAAPSAVTVGAAALAATRALGLGGTTGRAGVAALRRNPILAAAADGHRHVRSSKHLRSHYLVRRRSQRRRREHAQIPMLVPRPDHGIEPVATNVHALRQMQLRFHGSGIITRIIIVVVAPALVRRISATTIRANTRDATIRAKKRMCRTADMLPLTVNTANTCINHCAICCARR